MAAKNSQKIFTPTAAQLKAEVTDPVLHGKGELMTKAPAKSLLKGAVVVTNDEFLKAEGKGTQQGADQLALTGYLTQTNKILAKQQGGIAGTTEWFNYGEGNQF